MKRQNGATMRRKYVKASAIMAVMVFLLTGCGAEFPTMTAEEEKMIGEYAATLLLKYDVNHSSRLVSREEVEEEETKEEIKEQPKEEMSEPKQEGMDPVEDTPIIEIEQDANTDSGIENAGNLHDFYELPEGIEIIYQGNEVCDSYPQDEETENYFTLDATEGKRLVVLKFRIENQSQTEQAIDLLDKSTIIRVTVNGSYGRNVLTTMLLDDMATYKGTIPANETVEVILLAEMDDDVANNIASLMLNLKNESKTCTIQLK